MHRFYRSLFEVLIVTASVAGCDDDVPIIVERPPALEPARSPLPAPLDADEPPPAADAGNALTPNSSDAPGSEGTPNSLGTPSSSADTTELGPMPDLVLDTGYLVETATQDFIEVDDSCLLAEQCVTGIGTRRLVRFGTRTGNIGTADLLVGEPNAENPLWEYDECANAYHLDGYARYDLLDDATGEVVLRGAKNGFCMRDSEVYDPALVKKDCEQFACGDQGISVGCADNYVAGLECQWVDITDIDNGDYRIRVQINADSKLKELDYTNNVGFIHVRIDTTEVTVLR
jgi:hypothetical protein